MSLETQIMVIFQGFAIALGLVMGSFVNVCIVRWAEDRSVIAPRSQCPSCGTPIRAKDNIPLVSWMVLRGKCRDCETPISSIYPMMELLCGLLAWLAFRRFFQSPDDFDAAHWLAFAAYFGFVCMLVIGAYVDLKHYILPDEVTIYSVPFGFAAVWGLGQLDYVGWPYVNLPNSALGALGGSLFLGSIAAGSWLIAGREGMGLGDVKLLALIGAFLGLTPGVFFVLIIGSLAGSAVGIIATLKTGRRAPLPFGPPLAATAIVYVYYGDVIMMKAFPWLVHWP
jgi:leader peptidase (prepilin peptidase) / N-methyltransferase